MHAFTTDNTGAELGSCLRLVNLAKITEFIVLIDLLHCLDRYMYTHAIPYNQILLHSLLINTEDKIMKCWTSF